MRTRLLIGGVVWALATAAAFLLADLIVGAFVAIIGACLWAVAVLAADWDRHSSFEDRELDRAHRRAAKRERTQDARARDRARWEAHQARQADRARKAGRRDDAGSR